MHIRQRDVEDEDEGAALGEMDSLLDAYEEGGPITTIITSVIKNSISSVMLLLIFGLVVGVPSLLSYITGSTRPTGEGM
jgi:hypothetical protein